MQHGSDRKGARQPRLVFVNRYVHPDHSATSQILSDLASSLAATGFDVLLVGSRQRYDDPRADLPVEDRFGAVAIRRVGGSRFGRGRLVGRALDYLSFYVAAGWALLGLLRRGDVVVAKTDPPLLSVVVAAAARWRGARLVNWLQDVFPEIAIALGEPRIPAPAARLLAWLRDRSLTAARVNVAIGERMAERLAARVPAACFAVVPNWAHEHAVRPLPLDESELRHRLGLVDRFVVAYSGNLGRAHDHATIFDAAVALRAHEDIVFLVIGDGSGHRALAARAAATGLHNLRFLPYQPIDRLADSMAAANVHLVSLKPALEGLLVPSKFFGVLAAARPAVFIGDPDGELARVIRAADCGRVVRAGDGAALAAALLDLAADHRGCIAMGARARALLDTRYARQAAHSAWTRLLAEVADDGAAPR
jgi:glycosyltransferase involved in cell wall biosynthesis